MATSRRAGPISHVTSCIAPARTPGVLGVRDQGDPMTLSHFGDTPGPLGVRDYATPVVNSSLEYLLTLNKLHAITHHNNRSEFDKVARNGPFGTMKYRDIPGSRDARIEVEPEWIAANIVSMELPLGLQSLPKFGNVKSLRVNKHVLCNWRKVFMTISSDKTLLDLIDCLDPGTFYPRHIRKDRSKGISNHSWGTAIDINPHDHPLKAHVDEREDLNDANFILYHEVFKSAGFQWGNSYNDPMHFEILRF